MCERKIETRYGIEAYISEPGNICLKQESYMGAEDTIIVIDPKDVPTVITWLHELLEEVKNIEN